MSSKKEFRTYHTPVRHISPRVHLDPLCSTRLLETTTHQGCGSSSLLLHDYRQKIYYLYKMVLAREVYSMTIAGTDVRSLSYWLVQYTLVLLCVLYTLHSKTKYTWDHRSLGLLYTARSSATAESKRYSGLHLQAVRTRCNKTQSFQRVFTAETLRYTITLTFDSLTLHSCCVLAVSCQTLYQTLAIWSNLWRSYCDFNIWHNDLKHVPRVCSALE